MALSQDLSIALLLCPFHLCVLPRQNCSLRGEFLRSRMFGCLERMQCLQCPTSDGGGILLPESIDIRRHQNALWNNCV